MRDQDVISYARTDRMQNVSIFMSKFSGFGKTY